MANTKTRDSILGMIKQTFSNIMDFMDSEDGYIQVIDEFDSLEENDFRKRNVNKEQQNILTQSLKDIARAESKNNNKRAPSKMIQELKVKKKNPPPGGKNGGRDIVQKEPEIESNGYYH